MRSSACALVRRMGRHPVTAEVGRRLIERCRWVPGETIAVGCSGGVDSCVLLAACAAIAGRKSSRGAVVAIHVNHHLRPDADCDADHVEALACELGIPCMRKDVHPRRQGRGLASDARDLRHAALLEAAVESGASHIALAHHADDRLETLLMRLGRGSGLRGLGSIPWQRRSARGSAVRIVRPMLALARTDIMACAEAVGIAWRDDPGNVDPASARGLLRTQVIPALRSRWPRIAARASAAADGARAGAAAARAWSAARIGTGAPSRDLLRAAGADLGCILIDAWLRGSGIDATWSQVTRIARAAQGTEPQPRAFPAAGARITVRKRALTLDAGRGPAGR